MDLRFSKPLQVQRRWTIAPILSARRASPMLAQSNGLGISRRHALTPQRGNPKSSELTVYSKPHQSRLPVEHRSTLRTSNPSLMYCARRSEKQNAQPISLLRFVTDP